MGCSHSVREEKPRIVRKKHPPQETPLMPLQSNLPRMKHKIALKAITETTRQSPKVRAPIVSPALKVPKPPVESFINPYRIDSQQYYGYGGAAQQLGWGQNGGGGSSNRYRG